MLAYVDTHCHLDLNDFDHDRDEVIRKAIAAGVGLMINPGIDLSSSKKILDLVTVYTQIKAAVGLHPNDIPEDWQADLVVLEKLISEANFVAVGEIGLDTHHKQVPIERQCAALVGQLDLATRYKLPIIVHSREAIDLIYPVLQDFSRDNRSKNGREFIGVMHSFEGGIQEALRFIDLGFMIGLGGPVTYKNAHSKHELAASVPLEALVLETDSPFLTPVPYRGTRNEPAQIPQIGKRTAIIRGCSEETISFHTTRNACQLFRLGDIFSDSNLSLCPRPTRN